MGTSATDGSGRLDYAIAGAGVSGLYTAWRLSRHAQERGAPAPSIAVYESGDRIGGRLLTWLPMGKSAGLRAELGGMRFLDNQLLVKGVLDALGFTAADIVPFPVQGENLRLLLRGVSAPLAGPHPTARYLLPESEQGQTADQLIAGIIDEVLATPENKAAIDAHLGGQAPTSRQQWDVLKPYLTWRGTPLWDVGFWNLVSDVRSAETYEYIFDALGYYTLASNRNAAEAMQSLNLHFVAVAYHALRQGYEALPATLAEQATAAGAEVHCNTRLVGFEPAADGSSALTLEGPDGRFGIEAEHLVLAMQRRGLELLAPSAGFDLQGDARLRGLIESVMPMLAFKLFMFYEERWWERYGITVGQSICDLPIRQVYYIPPDPPAAGQPAPAFGLLMASYDDARSVDYWQGLIPRAEVLGQGRAELVEALAGMAERAGVATNDLVDPPPHLHKATDEMLRHAKQQLALLHAIPEDEIPEPVVGAFADWGLDPFGGGWTSWAPQVNVKEAMTAIKTPLGPERRVYVVGDGYSGVPGWVEGALSATEVVLEEHLGLERPPWLPADYYLGW
ncbi:MAG: FAD-dependent oxidoreductase [Actinomycetota bacterium]|nr:FAD-dependent oxidoreductase [Actinomycetota bacterium]